MTALERAFQLATSGQCCSVPEIREVLRKEGYERTQLEGPTLMKQLRGVIEKARASR